MKILKQCDCLWLLNYPPELKDELVRLQRQLNKCQVLTGTYPKPEAMHVTLKFIGEVPENQLSAVQSALKTIKTPIIFSQLTLLMVFGNPRFPKIIYVDMDSPQLADLAKKIEDSLRDISAPEEREFKPHLTLVRVKHISDSDKLLECLETLRVVPLSFSIEHFVLMQSVLDADGPMHTVVEQFDLTA